MRIDQLMTKDVATCGPDDTLEQAARVMWEHDCGFVPIVQGKEAPRVIGIVTDRDACMAAYTRGQALRDIPIQEVMARQIRACKPSDAVATAEATMREAQVHRLPVVDDGDHLLGVISLADIAREAEREVGSKRIEVSPVEVGETLSAIRAPRRLAVGA